MIIEPIICLTALLISYGVGLLIQRILKKHYDRKLIKLKKKSSELNRRYLIATMGDKISRRN